MITALDSRVMDANAVALGTSVEELMRNAGKAVADFVNSRYPGRRVRIFCGRGNNGGDGLAASVLIPGSRVTMVDGNVMKTDASRIMMSAVSSSDIFTAEERDFDVLIDAGLGTGLSGNLRPVWKSYVEFCNSFEGPIVSVDVPTGFGTDSQVVPDHTVCMVDEKTGMTPESCGEIIIADIGMPDEAILYTGPGDILRYPVPGRDSHKGDSGKLLIIGGGPYIGAPALAADAASRIGTDMVYVAVPSRVIHTVSTLAPESVIIELPGNHLSAEHLSKILEVANKCDAILIGPGLGTDSDTLSTVSRIIEGTTIPMVIDADALTAVTQISVLRKNIILTPHMGEFKRIGGKDKDPESVMDLASELGCTILLKGSTDIISDGEDFCLNNSGCSAMTSAGTGDVLAGTVAGLVARGMNAFDAGKLGSWIIGKAGESVASEFSYGLRASDLPSQIARELCRYLGQAGL